MENRQLVWYALVDEHGDAYKKTNTHYVLIPKEFVVAQFKDEVHAKNPSVLADVDAPQLVVYANNEAFVAKGTEATKPLIEDIKIGNYGESRNHALYVVVPEPRAKRQKVDENTSLEALWQYSEMQMTMLPPPRDLATLLQRPLPFRLTIQDTLTGEKIFDPNGPLLECADLSSLINHFTLACNFSVESMASENTWQTFYDLLLHISTSLWQAIRFHVVTTRNRSDNTTTKKLRPDLILHYRGMVLLRGEEKSAATKIHVPWKELTQKMRRWNPMFYGDLPYILGYATSGEQLRVVTIDRHLCASTILECSSIFQHKEEVLKLFYNLPFFLQKMTTLSKMTCSCPLLPYTPDVNEKRKIELMDDMVQRTIDRVQCRDQEDFDRLSNIYLTLQALNDKGPGMTHLQTVQKLFITKRRLVVQLGPLGFEQAPEDVTQAREWLLCILTALKYWHSCGYCHGDLRSQNIVYVPTGGSGYWVLIDMDESRLPNTTIIDWNHAFAGEKLCFQHDLYQLGKLLQTCTEGFTLPDNLKNLQTKLLSSVESPAFTAEVALTALQAG